jgi:hypothetical protein
MGRGALWLVSLFLCGCREAADEGVAAIASNLAKGLDVPQAVKAACRYIEGAIRTAPGLGKGHGPLNHFHSTYTLPFAP